MILTVLRFVSDLLTTKWYLKFKAMETDTFCNTRHIILMRFVILFWSGNWESNLSPDKYNKNVIANWMWKNKFVSKVRLYIRVVWWLATVLKTVLPVNAWIQYEYSITIMEENLLCYKKKHIIQSRSMQGFIWYI